MNIGDQSIYINGVFFTKDFPETKISLGSKMNLDKKSFYYMPSDRIEKGLFSELSVLEHYGLYKAAESKLLNWKKIKDIALKKISDFNIKANLSNDVNELSGGNQQRLMQIGRASCRERV